MNIIQALDDPQVFGPFFRGPTWVVWRVFLAALFALPLSEEQLAALLSLTHRTNPQKPVMIRGDGRSQWEHGVRVMGLCNKAKIKDYRVAALEENKTR